MYNGNSPVAFSSLTPFAARRRDDHLVKVWKWEDFTPNLEKGNLILTPWCGPEFQDEEEQVKDKSKEEGLARSGGEEDERCAVR